MKRKTGRLRESRLKCIVFNHARRERSVLHVMVVWCDGGKIAAGVKLFDVDERESLH